MTSDSPDTLYVVEQHNDNWEGPHKTHYTTSPTTALELALDLADKHRAEEWQTGSSTVTSVVFTMSPDDGNSGMVRIMEKPLHD